MKDNEQEIQKDKNYIVANTESLKVINVTDLKKDFTVGTQIVSVLKGLTFQINKGEFAVIIGASGSGKSTLLHTLLGLEPPTSGSVKVLDTEIYENTLEDDRSVFRKRHIGMVYQQPNWIRSLTVLENVAFPLLLLGVDKTESTKRAWEAIFNVGMREWTNYKPTELSGGQQQKVALARALVINPEIIVADEPTGNLDYESGKNLMEMLVDLNNQGRTIIMVTHDLEYLKYCNTAVRIKDGLVQGVYRGNDVTSILKDSGLGMKRAEDKDATKHNKDTPVNEVKVVSKTDNNANQSDIQDTQSVINKNTIKAQQVIERANQRINDMKKQNVTSIQQIIEEQEPIQTSQNIESKNILEKPKKENNINIFNKFTDLFKNTENKGMAKKPLLETNNINPSENTNNSNNDIESEQKTPMEIIDTGKLVDMDNTSTITISKPKKRKFKKSKRK